MRVPSEGVAYMDRSVDFPYEIDENDLCCRLFIQARRLKSRQEGQDIRSVSQGGRCWGGLTLKQEEIRSWPEDKPKKRRQRNR